MEKQVDFDKYSKFVDAVTSDESKDFLALSDRLVELDKKGANIERLLTAGVEDKIIKKISGKKSFAELKYD